MFGLAIFLIGMPLNGSFDSNLQELIQARELFYQSVEDKAQIKPAMKLFKKIYERGDVDNGRALTYIGALTALKGKHALMPHTKYKWVMKGLDLMDQGLTMNPDDIEALFIHGSTCYHLPFFFNRKDDAQRDFKRIVRLLPAHLTQYDSTLILNVIEFLEQHAKLNADEIKTIRKLKIDRGT